MGRSSKDRRDIFYRLAKEEGWRARSAYKLLHMDYELKLLENVCKAVDLCAAPGSWSQVLSQAMVPSEANGKRIVAVDIQDMAPIPGVVCFKGDITFDETATKIIQLLGNSKAEIVVCDGAPDVTGYHDFDEHLQSDLFMAALNISINILAPNGTFLAKIFRSSKEGVQWLFSTTEMFFKDVMIIKPRSSRSSSVEAYIVGRQFELPSGYHGFPERKIMPQPSFEIRTATCGNPNSFDSDTNSPLHRLRDYKYEFSVSPPSLEVLSKGYTMENLPPVQPPIKPAYEDAVQLRKIKKLGKCIVHPLHPILRTPTLKSLTLAFGGGAENLVNCGKQTTIHYSENSESENHTLSWVLDYISSNLITDRPELFIKDGDVRPGILVLVNDTDWEILGKMEYEIRDSDNISFISTLHGG